MIHYVSMTDGRTYGFGAEENVTDDMIKMTDSDFETYKNRPSDYHTFDGKTMTWKITKVNQSKLEAEIEATEQAEATAQVAHARTVVDGLIAPLQDAVDLEIETPEERSELKRLKTHRVALSRWRHPEDIPAC